MPLVSIGMPVFNGEQYIERAIRSILDQSLTDLELIISDNASEDRTEWICRRVAAMDSRVRYCRNQTNLGAHPNYNTTYHLSSGRYFKWAPHDDLLHPDFLKECVAVLESDRDIVVCQTILSYIDGDDQPIGQYDSKLVGSDSPSPWTRFRAVALLPHPAYEIMGLFRRSALEGSMLLGSFHGSDKALLAELALRGRFAKVSKPLLIVRDHQGRYTRAQATPGARAVWHDVRNCGKISLPTWRLYREYFRMIRRNLDALGPRMRCYAVLLPWWAYNWNFARMIVDVLGVLFPGSLRYAEIVKQSLVSPAPGADSARRHAGASLGRGSGRTKLEQKTAAMPK